MFLFRKMLIVLNVRAVSFQKIYNTGANNTILFSKKNEKLIRIFTHSVININKSINKNLFTKFVNVSCVIV